jgi:hypothetical protein
MGLGKRVNARQALHINHTPKRGKSMLHSDFTRFGLPF